MQIWQTLPEKDCFYSRGQVFMNDRRTVFDSYWMSQPQVMQDLEEATYPRRQRQCGLGASFTACS